MDPLHNIYSLPNQNAVRRFRFSALLLLSKWVFMMGSLGIFGYATLAERRDLTLLALGLLNLSLLVSIAHWIMATRARCPLCFVPSFSHQMCSKSSKARHCLGSYRLHVSLAVIFRGCFHCPYCGEPIGVKLRQQRHH